jgi:hypothetical protein
MQSVTNTTDVVSSNLDEGEAYQHGTSVLFTTGWL